MTLAQIDNQESGGSVRAKLNHVIVDWGGSVAVPGSPNAGDLWLSDSLQYVFADPSPAKRYPLNLAGQEASVWEYNGVLKIIYQVNGLATFISCTGDPTVAANWSAPVTVLGGGTGGFANFPIHGFLYIEGATLYYYFVDNTNQNVGVATASLTAADPPAFTYVGTVIGPQGTGLNGNSCVVKDGSTYRMFLECFHADAQPEATVTTWQVIMATCSTPTGSFTNVLDPVASLRPNSRASVSGLDIHLENGVWVAYYHGSAWGQVFPTDIYRATSANLATDSWTVDNAGFPFLRRTHVNEVDQVADPSVVRRANGTSYLVYTGADNRFALFKLMIAKLNPAWRRWDGFEWKSIQSGADLTGPQYEKYASRQFSPVMGPNGTTGNTVGVWTVDASQAPPIQVNTSNAQNDLVEYDVTLPPGNYQVDVYYQTGADRAIITLEYEDGAGTYSVAIGTIDGYAASGSSFNKATRPLRIFGTEEFRRRVRFKAASKNASSSGYKIAVHGWQIRDDSPYPTLVLNGDFSEGITFWGTPGTFITWSAAANALTIVRSGGFDAQPHQSLAGFVVGQTYKVTFDVATAGATVSFGGSNTSVSTGTGKNATWTATGATTNLSFWPTNDPATTVISNVQVRQVPS